MSLAPPQILPTGGLKRAHPSQYFRFVLAVRLRFSGGQLLQNYQLLSELLDPKFTDSQQHYQCRQWLELLSRYEMESSRSLDDNLKMATLVNGLCGNLQQHLLLSLRPTSTWNQVSEIVENDTDHNPLPSGRLPLGHGVFW